MMELLLAIAGGIVLAAVILFGAPRLWWAFKDARRAADNRRYYEERRAQLKAAALAKTREDLGPWCAIIEAIEKDPTGIFYLDDLALTAKPPKRNLEEYIFHRWPGIKLLRGERLATGSVLEWKRP